MMSDNKDNVDEETKDKDNINEETKEDTQPQDESTTSSENDNSENEDTKLTIDGLEPDNDNIDEDKKEMDGKEEKTEEEIKPEKTPTEVDKENTDENSQETPKNNKLEKLKNIDDNKMKLIIGVVGGLLAVAIIAVVVFLSGIFDEEPKPIPKKVDKNTTKSLNKPLSEPKAYNFNSKSINVARLNQQLELLTKHNMDPALLKERLAKEQRLKDKILSLNSELEKDLKTQKEKKLQQEKEQKTQQQKTITKEVVKNTDPIYKEETVYKTTNVKEEIKPIEKEPVQETISKNETQNKPKPEIQPTKEPVAVKQKDIQKSKQIDSSSIYQAEDEIDLDNMFSKYIQTSKIYQIKYKNKIGNVKMRLCNDFGQTILLIGPFKNDTVRSKVLSKISKISENTAYSIDYTQESLQKLCK
jgi:hypothetical protein